MDDDGESRLVWECNYARGVEAVIAMLVSGLGTVENLGSRG
jgi:hypothetical protein